MFRSLYGRKGLPDVGLIKVSAYGKTVQTDVEYTLPTQEKGNPVRDKGTGDILPLWAGTDGGGSDTPLVQGI